MSDQDLPIIGTRCAAREAFGWDADDPDLRHELGRGGFMVELQMIGTGEHLSVDEGTVSDYVAMYRSGGVNALPPAWAWEGGPYPLLITGAHRSTAARRAGFKEIPAWVVLDD